MAPKWSDYYGRLLSQAVEIHNHNFVAILHDIHFSEFASAGFDSDSLEEAWGAMMLTGDGVVHFEDIHHDADDLKEKRDDELEELLMQSVEENGKGLRGFRKTLTQDKFTALHGWKATGLKTKYYSIINKRKAEAQKKSSDSNSKAADAEKKSEETKKVYEPGSSNSDSSGSKAAKKAAKKADKKAAKKAAAAAAKAAKKRYKNKDKAKTVEKGKKKLGKGHDPNDPHGSSESSDSDSDGSYSYDVVTSKADELLDLLTFMSKGLEALTNAVETGFKNVIDAILKNKAT